MKILFAGASWQYPMYEPACANALLKLGVEVIPFSLAPQSKNWVARFEYKYSVYGFYLQQQQKRLLEQVSQHNPDVVLIWLGASIFPKTLRLIKQKSNLVLASYVHDDPFAHRLHSLSPSHHQYYWRAFIEGIPHYDLALFSKQLNVDEAYKFGAQKAEVLAQYFVPEIHHPRTLTSNEKLRFRCDIAFAGHFESDGREQHIRALAKAGLRVNVYADSSWSRASLKDLPPNFRKLSRVGGEDYPKALSGADICLCFMSKMNRDRYTTRCFEIPACGKLLLSERTDDLTQIFREDKEAVFFSSQEELVKKVLWLRSNPEQMKCIAEAGMKRVHADGHSVDARMAKFLSVIKELKFANE